MNNLMKARQTIDITVQKIVSDMLLCQNEFTSNYTEEGFLEDILEEVKD